jgi:MFS family permease
LLGVTTAVAHKVPDFREILFHETGVPIVMFGFILAATSIIGALFSYNVHKINKKLSAQRFYLFDLLIMTVLTILIGFSVNPIFSVIFFILFAAYGRSRRVPINTYLLEGSPTRQLKATYMSMLAFSASLNSIWIPLFLGYVIGRLGINGGYVTFGVVSLLLLLVLYALYIKGRRQQVVTPSPTAG